MGEFSKLSTPVMAPGKRKRSEVKSEKSPPVSPKKEKDEDSASATSTPGPPAAKRARHQSRLNSKSQMFTKQLTQKPDFSIVCHDIRIGIHSMLLSCRSSVFDTMFGGPFMESIDREMVVEDCEPGDLIEFLKYFYPKLLPKLKLRRGNVAQILYLAEKYQIPELKQMCQRSIEKISHAERSVARVMPWLKIAFDYNMVNLQRTIVLKVSKKFPDFDRTPTYKSLRPEVKLELMKFSKIVVKERMHKIRDMAFDDSRESSGHQSDRSTYSTSYKNRIITIQALFNGWEDGDSSGDVDEPGIDSDNVESDASGDELEAPGEQGGL